MNTKPKIHSSYPFLYYIWICACVVLIVVLLFNRNNIYFSVIISVVIALILYLLFLSYACTLTIEESVLRVKYLFPNSGKIEINLLEVDFIEFELSYFYLLEDDFKMGVFYLMHPYDTMVVNLKNGDRIIIKFNSSFFAARKIYLYLKDNFSKD